MKVISTKNSITWLFQVGGLQKNKELGVVEKIRNECHFKTVRV